MSYQEIKEKISVLAICKNGTIFPHAINWRRKKRKIDKVNLSYQEREGNSINYFVAVEAGGLVAKIKYNNVSLIWTIEEVWVE
jgi:hypothetical protein